MTDRPVAVVTGLAAVSALGRGTAAQLTGTLDGAAAFRPVRRFDVGHRRVGTAATLADAGPLADELAGVVDDACREAGLGPAARAGTPLLLAVHGGPGAGALAAGLAAGAGLAAPGRVYTSACVSASTAVADAAAAIAHGDAERVVIAAGYLVEPDQFALFDAGNVLATDGAARPFSVARRGLLLGDGVAAVVLESAGVAQRRTGVPLARIAGWGRAGDGYHPCRPDPDGRGLARAIGAALRRGGLGPAAGAPPAGDTIGYVNANGTGSPSGDAAEAAALHLGLGDAAGRIPVSSTKSVHGHALEASGLLELVVTVLAMGHGRLPVNAGFLGADAACPLDIVAAPRPVAAPYALSLNAAFGGANTALLVGAA